MDGGRSCLFICFMLFDYFIMHCYGITWCMHVCFCLCVKSLCNGVSGLPGACVSRPQAEMGYYPGGAPLVTRERNKLSDVP